MLTPPPPPSLPPPTTPPRLFFLQCAEVVRHRIAGVQMVVDVLSVANEDQAAKREKTSAVRASDALSIAPRLRPLTPQQVVVTLSKSDKGIDKKHIG